MSSLDADVCAQPPLLPGLDAHQPFCPLASAGPRQEGGEEGTGQSLFSDPSLGPSGLGPPPGPAPDPLLALKRSPVGSHHQLCPAGATTVLPGWCWPPHTSGADPFLEPSDGPSLLCRDRQVCWDRAWEVLGVVTGILARPCAPWPWRCDPSARSSLAPLPGSLPEAFPELATRVWATHSTAAGRQGGLPSVCPRAVWAGGLFGAVLPSGSLACRWNRKTSSRKKRSIFTFSIWDSMIINQECLL